jgi:hypothetical protein
MTSWCSVTLRPVGRSSPVVPKAALAEGQTLVSLGVAALLCIQRRPARCAPGRWIGASVSPRNNGAELLKPIATAM